MSSSQIYLDYAAATPLDERVFSVMKPYMSDVFFNPSSIYPQAREVRQALEQARWDIAQIMGAKRTEVIMTSGATESVNLAIFGIMKKYPGKHLVVTAIEHDAVLQAARQWELEGGSATILPVDEQGLIDLKQLEEAISSETVLVSVAYANNEIGTIQPIAKIGQLISRLGTERKSSLPLLFHTDASQAANYLDLHVNRLGVHLMTLSGSKIYGPKGSGCLYVRTGTELLPLIFGGGQEKGLRSGTENVAGIIGFSEALRLAYEMRHEESVRLANLRNDILTEIKKILPNMILNGHPEKRLPNNLNISLNGINGEELVLHLANEGILASTGSACSSGDVNPSHVLLSIGRSKAEAESSLRLSFGRQTSAEQADKFIAAFKSVLERMDRPGLLY